MANQQSNQPGSDAAWAIWLLAFCGLTPILPVLGFMLLLLGLLVLCAVCRWALVIAGLALFFICGFTALEIIANSKTDDASEAGWPCLMWAGIGLCLAARG